MPLSWLSLLSGGFCEWAREACVPGWAWPLKSPWHQLGGQLTTGQGPPASASHTRPPSLGSLDTRQGSLPAHSQVVLPLASTAPPARAEPRVQRGEPTGCVSWWCLPASAPGAEGGRRPSGGTAVSPVFCVHAGSTVRASVTPASAESLSRAPGPPQPHPPSRQAELRDPRGGRWSL